MRTGIIVTESVRREVMQDRSLRELLPKEFRVTKRHLNTASHYWCFDIKDGTVFAITEKEYKVLEKSDEDLIFLTNEEAIELNPVITADAFTFSQMLVDNPEEEFARVRYQVEKPDDSHRQLCTIKVDGTMVGSKDSQPQITYIGIEHFDNVDEYYGPYFRCPKCDGDGIEPGHIYCPTCGVRIELKLSDKELRELM